MAARCAASAGLRQQISRSPGYLASVISAKFWSSNSDICSGPSSRASAATWGARRAVIQPAPGSAFSWRIRTWVTDPRSPTRMTSPSPNVSRTTGMISPNATESEVFPENTGRPPHTTPGLMIYVMVADLTAALERARTAGGEVLSRSDSDASERIASVRDPAGNVIGVYEQPGLAEAESKLSPIPEHLQAVTPRLAVPDAMSALDFYTRAFGAGLLGEPCCDPAGKLIYAELQIGDSVVLLTDDDGYRALLSTYWEDVDAAWGRAIAAGAKVIYPLADQFYGERGGGWRTPTDSNGCSAREPSNSPPPKLTRGPLAHSRYRVRMRIRVQHSPRGDH